VATILVANDNQGLLDDCRWLLEQDGHAVTTVMNGRKVLELALTQQPDLVLLDWMMPEVDGVTAIEILRADPATAGLTLMMMSAADDGEARARAAGADAFIRKPFDADDLLARVRDVLDGRPRAHPEPERP
jgi:DNA-binding response OmpR family regulator